MLRNPSLTVAVKRSHKFLALASPRLISTSKQIFNRQRYTATKLYQSHHSVLTQSFQKNPNNSKHVASSSRKFSDKPPSGGGKTKDIPNEERTEIVLTPGQKVAAGTRLTMYLGIAAAGLTCLFFTARELIPTKMSPNTVFNNAHSAIENHADVKYKYGTPIKTYGRDHGGKREGRRNFIEHTEHTDQEDGSKRVRVRFNLEGPKGNAFVFAEVSKDMPSGEFVYLLVQDKRSGRVITVIDNRSMLAAKRMAGGSKEGEDAFAGLLSGGRR
jgi:import inner membrane translocase subunit TIM21